MSEGAWRARLQPGELATPANLVTFGRLCIVPLAVWLALREQLQVVFWLFLVAGASDALDGWLARRFGLSALGGLLDPIADKALLICMFVALAVIGVLPDFVAILVVFRDILIVGGVVTLRMLGHPMTIRPLWISKLNTALQILLVGVALLVSGYALNVPAVLAVLVWTVVASTVVSGAAYVWKVARS